MASSIRSTPASEAWRSLLTTFTAVHNALAAEMEEAVGLLGERLSQTEMRSLRRILVKLAGDGHR